MVVVVTVVDNVVVSSVLSLVSSLLFIVSFFFFPILYSLCQFMSVVLVDFLLMLFGFAR